MVNTYKENISRPAKMENILDIITSPQTQGVSLSLERKIINIFLGQKFPFGLIQIWCGKDINLGLRYQMSWWIISRSYEARVEIQMSTWIMGQNKVWSKRKFGHEIEHRRSRNSGMRCVMEVRRWAIRDLGQAMARGRLVKRWPTMDQGCTLADPR
jgi:hypothetical protein